MIKCRTKKLAINGVKLINQRGIYCEFDNHYNIYAFKSVENEYKGLEILKQNNYLI